MSIRWNCLYALLLVGAVIMMPRMAHTEEQQSSHRTLSGVVVKQGTGLAVKTPDGASYQVNENQSHRHGHPAFKEGDEVSVVVDENNTAIDLHHKGEEGKHTFVTGKLIHGGQTKKEVKLQTADGEKVFPLKGPANYRWSKADRLTRRSIQHIIFLGYDCHALFAPS